MPYRKTPADDYKDADAEYEIAVARRTARQEGIPVLALDELAASLMQRARGRRRRQDEFPEYGDAADNLFQSLRDNTAGTISEADAFQFALNHLRDVKAASANASLSLEAPRPSGPRPQCQWVSGAERQEILVELRALNWHIVRSLRADGIAAQPATDQELATDVRELLTDAEPTTSRAALSLGAEKPKRKRKNITIGGRNYRKPDGAIKILGRSY